VLNSTINDKMISSILLTSPSYNITAAATYILAASSTVSNNFIFFRTKF